MTRETYRVSVTREGKWWIVDVPGVDYRTQARSLTEVDEMARDLVAGATGADEDSFALDIDVQPPAAVVDQLGEAVELETSAQQVKAQAAQIRREAVRRLRTDYGLSAADIARSLGLSRGRVYQLLEDHQQAA